VLYAAASGCNVLQSMIAEVRLWNISYEVKGGQFLTVIAVEFLGPSYSIPARTSAVELLEPRCAAHVCAMYGYIEQDKYEIWYVHVPSELSVQHLQIIESSKSCSNEGGSC